MHAPLTLPTRPTETMTHTTTPVSGPSTGELLKQVGRLLGELDDLLVNDPYWPIVTRLYKLLARKRGYYGCAIEPLQNALGVADDGITPWKYQVARIGEKCRRLRGVLRTIDISETLLDIAGHSVVGMAVLEYSETKEAIDESQDPTLAGGQPDSPDGHGRTGQAIQKY